ncbi:MAG: bifunctional diguanylate cyclase/phosphodiesterase [Gammaproteobacteria bacterium]
MKLRHKLLLGLSLTWLGFVALGVAGSLIFLEHNTTTFYFLASFAVLTLFFSFTVFWFFKTHFLNRLDEINHNVNAGLTEQNNHPTRIELSGNDELYSLSKQINNLIDIFETLQNHFEQRVLERTDELQKTNEKLEQHLAQNQSLQNELAIHREHLVRLAHYDELTSLPNQIFFNEMLNKTINHAHRHKKMMAILFVDLDRFKNINDTLGRSQADSVLKNIAERFSTALRSGDILARVSGDEFIILLNDIEQAKFAGQVAEKLIQECSKPFKIDDHVLSVTTSISICIYPTDGASLEELQKNAALAMYKAKRSGGGVFNYFTKEMNIEAHKHIQLDSALHKAISNNEFVLYYQPKLNLKNGRIEDVEALIRWENPELGLVSPLEFIPLAEETGLIMAIGEWALRDACRANKAWQESGYQPITVSVNLSSRQFQHPDLTQMVAEILAETGLDAKFLELEVTEQAIMANIQSSAAKFDEFKRMGVAISIDDFGTGYTSISYLKQLPIRAIKIDQRFIKGIPANSDDAAIAKAIISLAHSLDIEVVAEGVETATQLEYLADNHCNMVQGYYLSRPLPEQKIVLQFSKVTDVEEQGVV